MMIAEALRYADSLEAKLKVLERKVKEVETQKISQRVISQQETGVIVEQTEFTISPKELTAEYDSVAKELRLLRAWVDLANHTTDIDFTAKY